MQYDHRPLRMRTKVQEADARKHVPNAPDRPDGVARRCDDLLLGSIFRCAFLARHDPRWC